MAEDKNNGNPEAVIESLRKELADKESQLKDTNAQLETANKELVATKGNLEKSLTEVGELATRLDLQEKFGQKGLVVKVGKKAYQIRGKSFHVPGIGKLSAKQLSENQDALKLLIGKKSAILREVKG